MKAIVIHELGNSSKLKYEETEIPKIKEDEILIKQEAVGLNFVDIYFRTGLYKFMLPFIPGQEGAGVVKEVGTKVKDFKQEDKVAYLGVMGSYAEFIKIPAIKAVKLPDEISTKNAAALMLQGLTAHYLTHSTYPLKKGDSCLVHAAAGGVGLLLTQIAKIIGAFVIGTTSTSGKAQLAKKAGCDEVIIYSKNDFESEVKRITNGKGVKVVYDSVGKDTFDKSLNCLMPRGYIVLFGQASGPVHSFDPQILNAKGSLFLTRPSLTHYIQTKKELLERINEVFDWFISRKVKLLNITEYPLKDAAMAQDDLANRKTTGKVILIP